MNILKEMAKYDNINIIKLKEVLVLASEQKKSVNKNKSKKRTNRPLILLIIVAIIAVGVTYWLKVIKDNNDAKQNNNNSGTSTTQEEQAEVPEQEEGVLIDMNNTTNAKVENGEKVNTSSELYTEKTFQGMAIKDINLKTENYISTFTATVENNSGADYAGGKITIVFTNQDGSEYYKLNTILPQIKNGETNEISAQTTADIINAYNFSIE